MGRGSDMLVNEEMHKIIESIRHLLDKPEGSLAAPEGKLDGSLWLDSSKNELKYYDKEQDEWIDVFANKFKIVDQLLNDLPPGDPVIGQLWLNDGMLMYYDGSNWQPIKALMQDGSQINLAAFEDFLVISPLNPSGNCVVDDTYERAVLGGKLDLAANSQYLETDEKFGPNWICPANKEQYTEPIIPGDLMSQFLIPNANVDRFYIDNQLVTDYKRVNGVTIQYPRVKLDANVPSLVHVNPGKITKITKRLFKINKFNSRIKVSAFHTEFYGFKNDSVFGEFLRPGKGQDKGDYTTVPEGINLNYDATQNYDYLLAICYDFSWIKSSGRLTKTCSADLTTSYYVGEIGGPLNVFVDGYDLEDQCFDFNSEAQIVNIKEETRGLEVSLLRVARHEYGFIREVDLQGRGVIKLLSKFRRPLVLVNGEAMHPTLGDLEFDNDKIYVRGAKRNMVWSIIELEDVMLHDDMFYEASTVTKLNGGVPSIKYDNTLITDIDDMVLFVDGLLIKKEHLIRDNANGFVTVDGLQIDQEYILLKDKYHNLYDEKNMVPALQVGKIDETLVFLNGYLLCNDTAFVTVDTQDVAKLEAANGELKLFAGSELDRRKGDWCIYDEYEQKWLPMEQKDIDSILFCACSYDNTLSAIKLNIPFNSTKDVFNVYAYAFANSIGHPLIVRSFYAATGEKAFTIDNTYLPDVGALSVWVNGVRQYYVKEYSDGTGFELQEPVQGPIMRDANGKPLKDAAGEYIRGSVKITYVIETPEKGMRRACTREILTKDAVIPGSANAYRTQMDLYPGRVTVYLGGMRLQKEAWTILDNHTFLIKAPERLTGDADTFPEKKYLRHNGKIITIHPQQCDEILIEIRQEYQRIERTILWEELNDWDIGIEEYDLPKEILEAADEILIFVNGVFTGLRSNLGYYKDRARGCITILSGSTVEALCSDPLFTYLSTHQDKKMAYREKHGHDYVPKIKNKITLEWR